MREMLSLRSLKDLVVATIKDSQDDRVLGLGAEVAFFSILSLPPTLLAIFGTVGYVAEAIGPKATQQISDRIIGAAAVFLTPDTTARLRGLIDTFLSEGRVGVASIGIVLALWAASRATKVSIEAVNIAYDLKETRGPVRRRLIALGFTALGICGAVVLIPLVVAGPRIGAAVGRPLGVGEAFATIWRVLYWPGVGVLGIGMLATFYHFAPSWKTPWRREIPGAVLAVALWLAGGAGLRLYAVLSLESNSAYKGLAAPVVLLLWLYVTALAVLLGAELNAEIEKMWPTSGGPADPGSRAEKVSRELGEDATAPVPAGPWPPRDTGED